MLPSTSLLGLAFLLLHAGAEFVSLRLHNGGGDSKQFIHVNFYNDFFDRFFSCLSSRSTLVCTVNIIKDMKSPFQPTDKRVKDFDKPVYLLHPGMYTNYFKCRIIAPGNDLSCTRLPDMERSCDSLDMSVYIRIVGGSSVNCVGLKWNFLGETLLYDPKIHKIETCDRGCNATAATNTSLPHLQNHNDRDRNDKDEHHNDRDNSFNNWRYPRRLWEDYNDKKTHIIIAVVVGIVVTAIIIVGAAFFRRTLLRMRARNKDPEVDDRKNQPKPSKKQKAAKTKSLKFTSPQSIDQSSA